MSLPFIDVVVCTYNRASMLERIVSSLMAQTYPAERYLVTVVDDGSEDETWRKLQQMAARDNTDAGWLAAVARTFADHPEALGAVGATVKNILIELPWLFRNPALYIRFLVRLLRERLTLLTMFPAFWRAHRSWVKGLQAADPEERANSVGVSK